MARATDRRPPRPAPCPAWLGLWLLAGLSTAQAGHADHAETPPPGNAGPQADGTAPAVTLRTLVDIARRNKAAELGEATARLAGTPLPPGASAGRLPARDRSAGAPPRLWSLTAAGGRWRAEVLLDGRVHAVDASSGPAARIGPWRVVGPTPDGLHIEQIAAVGVSPRRLVLPPPGRGASTASYRFGRPRPPSTNAANATGSAVAAPTDRGEDIDAGHARADDEGSGDGGSEGDADAAVRRAAALPMPAVPARPGTSGPSTHAAPSVAPSIP